MKRSGKITSAFIRSGFTLALLAVMLMPPLVAVRADTPFTVTSSLDAQDSSPGDGYCYNGVVEGCTLRAAIEEANALLPSSSNQISINFSGIPNGSTISLTLGTILWTSDYVTVDGGTNNIIINGAGLSAGQGPIQITGDHNMLENLSIAGARGQGVLIGDSAAVSSVGNYNTLNALKIFGGGTGIHIDSTLHGGADFNQIWNSRIGASSTSTACSPDVNNSYDGISIYGPAQGTLITNNRIVCNGADGIILVETRLTTISNNFIGTDGEISGLGNAWYGIEAQDDLNATISNNVISGNTDSGIILFRTSGANIYNNKIGTNTIGTIAIPNGKDGIQVAYNSTDISIGSSTDANKKNIISGNGKCGVRLADHANHNILDGNYIGLGTDGMTAIPNGEAGVAIIGANDNTLSTAGDSSLPQFISSNTREGVYILNSDGTIINKRTFIGVAADYGTPRGNGLEGVKLDTGTINSKVYSQKIVYNGAANNPEDPYDGAGIALVNSNTITGNFLMPWFVGRNSGLPIDLGNNGHTENGPLPPPPGPNGWQNYPDTPTMTADGFNGQTCANCYVYIYHAVNDPIRPLGGGGTPAEIIASPTGTFSYTFPAYVDAVTMVTCDMVTFNCSEMSPKVLNPAWHYVYLPLVKK